MKIFFAGLLALTIAFFPTQVFANIASDFGVGRPIAIMGGVDEDEGFFVEDIFVTSNTIVINMSGLSAINLDELVVSLFFEGPQGGRVVTSVASDTTWNIENMGGLFVLTMDISEVFDISASDLNNLQWVNFGSTTAVFNEQFFEQGWMIGSWDRFDGLVFETPQERLLFLGFGNFYTTLLPHVVPINQTIAMGDATITIDSVISVDMSHDDSNNVQTHVLVYTDGLGPDQNNTFWGYQLITSLGNTNLQTSTGSSYFDEQTGRGYFLINLFLLPEDIQQGNMELSFDRVDVGVENLDLPANANLANIIASHNPTFIPDHPGGGTFWSNGLWGVDDATELGDMAFLTDPTSLQAQGTLAINELDMDLGFGVTLGNIALNGDLLRVQFLLEDWGITRPMVQSPTASPTLIYDIHFMQATDSPDQPIITELIYYLGDLSEFVDWPAPATSIQDLDIFIFYTSIDSTIYIGQSIDFSINMFTPPNIFIESAPFNMLDTDFYLYNININGNQISFRIWDTYIIELLATDQHDLFDFELSAILTDGTTQQLHWNTGSLAWPHDEQEHIWYSLGGFGIDVEDIAAFVINDTIIQVQ